jgi:hypothetical protein
VGLPLKVGAAALLPLGCAGCRVIYGINERLVIAAKCKGAAVLSAK